MEYPLLNTLRRGVFRRDLEDPTALAFKVEFGIIKGQSLFGDKMFTFPAHNNKIEGSILYDHMPTPFFQLPIPTTQIRSSSLVDHSLVPQGAYSAYTYLLNSNQDARAEMLLDFIGGWHELQTNHPYLFESVSGIQNLLNIEPKYGPRIKEGYEGAKVTFTMRDTLDQRVRHMLSLYRSIVWDDKWHKHTMPDMSRFFKMYIYISDYRLFTKRAGSSIFGADKTTAQPEKNKDFMEKVMDFEVPQIPSSRGASIRAQATNILTRNLNDIARGVTDRVKGKVEEKLSGAAKAVGLSSKLSASALNLVMEVVDTIAPVTMIECDMCDIDIRSINKIFSNNYDDTKPGYSTTFNFIVNVRNVNVTHRFTATIDDIDEAYASEVFYRRFPTAEKYSYLGADKVPTSISTIIDDKIISINNTDLNQGNDESDYRIASLYLKGSNVVSDAIHLADKDRKINVLQPYYFTDVPSVENNKYGGSEASSPLWGTIGGWVDKLGKWVEGSVGTRLENAIEGLTFSPVLGGHSVTEYLETIGTQNVIGLLGLIQDSMRKKMEVFDITKEQSDAIFNETLKQISMRKPSDEAEEVIINTSKEVLSNMTLYSYMESYAEKHFIEDIVELHKTEEDDKVGEENLFKSEDGGELNSNISLISTSPDVITPTASIFASKEKNETPDANIYSSTDEDNIAEPNLLSTPDSTKIGDANIYKTSGEVQSPEVHMHSTDDKTKMVKHSIFASDEREYVKDVHLTKTDDDNAIQNVDMYSSEEDLKLKSDPLYSAEDHNELPGVSMYESKENLNAPNVNIHETGEDHSHEVSVRLHSSEESGQVHTPNLYKTDDGMTEARPVDIYSSEEYSTAPRAVLHQTEDVAQPSKTIRLHGSSDDNRIGRVSIFASEQDREVTKQDIHETPDEAESVEEAFRRGHTKEYTITDKLAHMEKIRKEHKY